MKSTKFKGVSFLVTCWSLLLAGCVHTGAVVDTAESGSPPSQVETGSAQTVTYDLDPLGGFFESPLKPAKNQSRIVFYQTTEERLRGATGIFVDGAYHASITPGAWSQLCYKFGEIKLSARQMQVGAPAQELPDSITMTPTNGGQTYFFKVVQDNARPVIQPVPTSQALKEMDGSRQQIHTISRVAQECAQEAVGTSDAPVSSEPRTHLAYVLFEFDRSDAKGMTRASLQLLDAQVAKLQTQGFTLQRVHVVGHADPLGRADANERLAQLRAQTVRDYFSARMAQDVRVTSESRGAKEPVVDQCGRVATARSVVCNAFNRRVDVLLVGTFR